MIRRLTVAVVALAVGVALGVSPASAGTKAPKMMSISAVLPIFFCCTLPQTQTVTVTDIGGNPTGNLTVKIQGQGANNFKVSNNGCNSVSLVPGASCTFDITWLVGPDSFPTLTVTGKNGSVSVGLFGTAHP